MNLSRLEELVFRAWFYFQKGYSTYLTFLLGIVSFISTTYYLTISHIPYFRNMFPTLTSYVLVLFIILPPVAVAIGWIHMKKTLAFTSQTLVNVESNPYTYKIRPGVSKEVVGPLYLMSVHVWRAILSKEGILTPELDEELDRMEDALKRYVGGEYIGAPKELRMTKGRRR